MIASHLAVVTLSFLMLALQADIVDATPLKDGPQRRLIIATIPDNPLSQVGMPLLEQIYQKVGVAVEFRPIPPARATNMLMREQLDGNGFDKVKIVASSGFGPDKCRVFALADAPVDVIGTGSYLPQIWSQTYATADIVAYDAAPRVKAGREFLLYK